MKCKFDYDALVYKVEALRMDAVDGVFQFHIEEEETGQKVAEIKQNIAEAEEGPHDGGLLFSFPAPAHLRAGVSYQTSGNCIYLFMEGGFTDRNARPAGKLQSLPNAPY